MRFARLVDEQSVDAAVAAAQAADAAGFTRVWLSGDPGCADPRAVAGAARMKRATLVLQLDPGADASLPKGLPIEIAVTGAAGWRDSLRAVTAGAEYSPPPPAWVVAENVGTAAEAARAGIGAALASFENPDDAAEWVDEYEAELGAASARAELGRVNAACAVFVDSGGDADQLVGVIERYREAGIDEVILRGAMDGDPETVEQVMAEFDDAEVRQLASERERRRAPNVTRLEDTIRSAQEDRAPAAGKPRRRSSGIAKRAQKYQEGAVRGMSDRQLEALVGNRLAIPLLFRSMAGRYRPAKAGDFSGAIEFKLATPHGDETWTIDCAPSGASARRGGDPEAKLHVEAKLADFLRVGVGEIAAPGAVLSGKLNIRGDFALALRMGEMFGGPPVV